MLYRCESCRCLCPTTPSSLCRVAWFERGNRQNRIRNSAQWHSIRAYTRHDSYLYVYKLNNKIKIFVENEKFTYQKKKKKIKLPLEDDQLTTYLTTNLTFVRDIFRYHRYNCEYFLIRITNFPRNKIVEAFRKEFSFSQKAG